MSKKYIDTLLSQLIETRKCGNNNIVLQQCDSLYPFLKWNKNFIQEYALACYYNGDYIKSFTLYKQLQGCADSMNDIYFNEFNSHFSVEYFMYDYSKYSPDNVKKATMNVSENPKITVTMTTCMRMDLFELTLNSFLECCLDVNLVGRWLLVDDNTPGEVLDTVLNKYPFLECIKKGPSDRGHAKSMNIIKNNVKSPFMIHMEDDWLFYYKDTFITKMLEIINQEDSYKQVLFNLNYSEIPQNHDIVGGILKRSYHTKQTFVEHDHAPVSKYSGKKTCSYWPHFSFRPSLVDTSIFQIIGDFSETANHFEMEYANRYTKLGFKSCFLPHIVSRHIGKLTSEKHGVNAYVLNSQKQFEQKVIEVKMDFKVINLDRRIDRWNSFCNQGTIPKHLLNRFSAVDGKTLQLHQQHYLLFEGNDYNYRAGIVGCALSHLKIWVDFATSHNDITHMCIFEDDITVKEEFMRDITQLTKLCCENDVDVLYFGHQKRDRKGKDEDIIKPEIFKVDVAKSFEISYGGNGSYIISKTGAIKLLQFIERVGMTNAIDTMVQKAANVCNIYYTSSDYAIAKMYYVDNDADTDIQNVFDTVAESNKTLIENEVLFLGSLGISDYIISDNENDDCIFKYKLRDIWVIIFSCSTDGINTLKSQRFTQRIHINDNNGVKPFIIL